MSEIDQAREAALGRLLAEVASTGYRFTAPTPETHRRINARPGNEMADDLTDVFGWSRPFALGLLPKSIVDAMQAADALESIGVFWRSRVRVGTLGGRHYLHSAFPTTAPDSVFFGPDTYRFIRSALQILPKRPYSRAIDIGCGSGAGGLAVAAARDIGGLCLADINPRAVMLARVNAAHQGRAAASVESDLFASVDGVFDLILSNPPYLVDPAGRAYRDGGGALGLKLGLDIVKSGLERLGPAGILFIYTGTPVVRGKDRFRAGMEQILPSGVSIAEYDEIDPDIFGEELDNQTYRTVDRIAAVAAMIVRSR